MTDLHKDLALTSQADAIISSLPILSSLASTKGKDKSDLFFMSTIKCPQLWPNHFVTHLDASHPAYGDLDMAQFVCGYLDCICQSPVQLQPLMFDHLYTLMDLATYFQWSAVWAFHGGILHALEQGSISWQSDFSRFQVGLFLPSQELPVHACKPHPTKAADRDLLAMLGIFLPANYLAHKIIHTSALFAKRVTIRQLTATSIIVLLLVLGLITHD